VFAAASLQTALDVLAPVALQTTGVGMRMSYAASSALARQIENGAPADVFMSADLEWMDYLQARRLIRPETRVKLLGNELVLIAARARPVTLTIGPGFPLAQALGGDRLALADPEVVPAGRYARAALTSLGVWSGVATKIAAAENVRAALRLVALGEAPLGIVYRTDALAESSVTVVGAFPPGTHPPIVYPLALTSTSSPEAATILEFLKGPAASKAFVDQGFTVPARD
jgi:molybdate transport system substrate-binding protein